MIPKISSAQAAYLRKQKQQKWFVKFSQLFILIFFLTIWELSVNANLIDGFIFSSPSRICKTFYSMCVDGSFFLHLGTTLAEVFVSFTLIIGIGYAIAVLLWFFPNLSKILEPYFVVLNSLPKSALAPLLIVWLGATPTTIIVAGMSVALFGSIMNLYTTFRGIDEELLKLIYTLGGNKFHALTKVVIPSSIPEIISNMKVNIGLCLVGVVIGEFLAARNGLGYLIIYSSQVFKLDWLLMSICILCIIAMGLYALIGALEKRYKS